MAVCKELGVDLDRNQMKVALLLQRDGRMSYTEMAQRVGVTERTIRRKYEQLVDGGYMQVRAYANPVNLGLPWKAFIGVDVAAPQIDHVVDELRTHEELSYIAVGGGLHDLVLFSRFATREGLYDYLIHRLDGVQGILNMKTSIVLRMFKIDYAWGLGINKEDLGSLYSELDLPHGCPSGYGPNGLRVGRCVRQALDLPQDRQRLTGQEQVELGRVERQMIELLCEDGRMSYVDLANVIGVSEETVRRRFLRLVGENVIRIGGVGNPFKLGMLTPALISVSIDHGKVDQVVEKLTQVEQVVVLAATTGNQDLQMIAYFRHNNELADFINHFLGTVEGVKTARASLLFRMAGAAGIGYTGLTTAAGCLDAK